MPEREIQVLEESQGAAIGWHVTCIFLRELQILWVV